ncbi:MAG: ATP-binding cassette domain-containing protein [Anaerolineales bacterium]|nr:ATP-binding cassette domain-containing protein [Anaerolineales bacterium]
MIDTKGLTKRFGDVLAVDGLDMEVSPGEIFGFLGPNGAGKTTTIRMLSALISPTSGKAKVAGYEVGREDNEIRRNVGILTESPGLYDRLSAERNLSFFAELHDVEDVAGQVERYLRLLGLWDRRGDVAATFSKGMRQKLAIARAMLHEPNVLLLDEPTAGLDPEMARLVREFIGELKDKGRTIFLCTHNLDEADRLCDRIAVVNSRLLALDTPEALRAKLYDRVVVVHLSAASPAYEKVVSEQPFVRSVEIKESKLVVGLDDPERNNPELIRALVDAGADIQFVGELRRSLEEIYLRLVK